MTFYGPLFLIFLVGGLLLGYFILRRQMLGEIAELRKLLQTEQQKTDEAEPDVKPEASSRKVEVAPPKQKPELVPPAPVASPSPAKQEITPEILAIIAAAVAQFVGAGARIRSTRMLPMPEGNAWAQQGRVIIQASHNLAMR